MGKAIREIGRSTAVPTRHEVAERFRRFADEVRENSPLYASLAARIADRDDLLDLVRAAQPGQRRPSLLFAAVRRLLADDPQHPLARIYDGRDGGDAWPAFAALCVERWDELRVLVIRRRTQTNEVGRAAGLLPALQLAADRSGQPLALLEIGASAGLNLLVDAYAYDYPPAGATQAASPVVLRCKLRGRGVPPIPAVPPRIVSRTGIDTQPLDVVDPETERWLEACLWPEQVDREARLRAALTLARNQPPSVHEGDAVDDVLRWAQGVPAGAHLCVLDTWTLNYLSRERRTLLSHRVGELAVERDVTWISQEAAGVAPHIEPPDRSPVGSSADAAAVLGMVTYSRGRPHGRGLAWMHPHGAWIDWLDGHNEGSATR